MEKEDYRGIYSIYYITLSNNEKSLYIAEIKASKYGCGYGSSMLKEILEKADKEHISTCLHANCGIYEDGGLNQEELENWYFRNGFNLCYDLDPSIGYNFFYRDVRNHLDL